MLRPEEEAMNVMLSTHRGAITWFLSKRLTETSDIQRNQQEVRLMREVEKSKRYEAPTDIPKIQYCEPTDSIKTEQ
jgi:syntaxin 18